jgi:membrane-associated phospholipid phosphatase
MFLLESNFWSSLLSTLSQWDRWLFLKINTQWTNNFLDNVYPWFRDQNTWMPLYLFLFIFTIMNFGWRIWPWILFFIITVSLTDQISSTLLKNWVNRTRPCHNQSLADQIRLLVVYCPGSGSFTSSHASNHFGLACYIFFTMRTYFKNWAFLFFGWAATISYGQVYVGIHYPLDVVGGAILGCGLGLLTASIFNKRIGLPPLLDQQNKKLYSS